MKQKGLLRPSTRAFWREIRLSENPSFFNFLHGYLYGRWTYFYIAMGTGRHPLAKRLAPLLNWIGGLIVSNAGAGEVAAAIKMEDTYHGKVLPLAAAKQLVSVKEDISLKNLEHVVPYALARDIVLQHPDHIVALDCPCRMASEHPCLPMDVCLIVGEPFASFVTDHNPNHSRWISSQQAQDILQAEDKRGHVHHAFFKDAMAGRFYAICNCCACCCGAMQAQHSGTPMLASSGYVACNETAACTGCSRCQRACQFNAISMDTVAVIDPTLCMGCGVCVAQCKSGAIRLERASDKGVPLEIEALLAAAQKSCSL